MRQFSTGGVSFEPILLYQHMLFLVQPTTNHTEGCVCGRIRIEVVDADKLVVCSRSEIFPIWREADRVNRSRVVVHSSELLRFRVFGIAGVENGVGGPNAHMSICV